MTRAVPSHVSANHWIPAALQLEVRGRKWPGPGVGRSIFSRVRKFYTRLVGGAPWTAGIDPEPTSVPRISTAAVPWKADVLLSPSRAHPHAHRRAVRSATDLSLPRTAGVGNTRPNGRIRSDPSGSGVRLRPERKLVTQCAPHPSPKQSRVGDPPPLASTAAQTAASGLPASPSPSSKGPRR
jgi:hypothetical protein